MFWGGQGCLAKILGVCSGMGMVESKCHCTVCFVHIQTAGKRLSVLPPPSGGRIGKLVYMPIKNFL